MTKSMLAAGAAAGMVVIVLLFMFIRARSTPATAACINNLRQIESGKGQWMLENGKTTNDVPTWDDVNLYIGRTGETNPAVTCPGGGTYTLGKPGEKPTCSLGGPSHTLP